MKMKGQNFQKMQEIHFLQIVMEMEFLMMKKHLMTIMMKRDFPLLILSQRQLMIYQNKWIQLLSDFDVDFEEELVLQVHLTGHHLHLEMIQHLWVCQ